MQLASCSAPYELLCITANLTGPSLCTAAALACGRAALTEDVADLTHIAADHSTAGRRHPGVLITLSNRFSRRPAGIPHLIAAIHAAGDEQIANRVVYLRQRDNQ
jgi:hypothetical protein